MSIYIESVPTLYIFEGVCNLHLIYEYNVCLDYTVLF